MILMHSDDIYKAALTGERHSVKLTLEEIFSRECQAIAENIYREAEKGQFGITHIFSKTLELRAYHTIPEMIVRKFQHADYKVEHDPKSKAITISWDKAE